MKNEIIKKKFIKLISIYHYGVVYFYGIYVKQEVKCIDFI